MRRRSIGSESDDLEALTHEVAALRAELEARIRRDEGQHRFDALSDALVGALEPEEVVSRAERWATAALGRPCSIVTRPPVGTRAIALGSGLSDVWLTVDGDVTNEDDEVAVATVVERIGRALDAARRVSTQADGMR